MLRFTAALRIRRGAEYPERFKTRQVTVRTQVLGAARIGIVAVAYEIVIGFRAPITQYAVKEVGVNYIAQGITVFGGHLYYLKFIVEAPTFFIVAKMGISVLSFNTATIM